MTTSIHDGWARLAQAGAGLGAQLVRITALQLANRYSAMAVEFDGQGRTQLADDRVIAVTNLGEAVDAGGLLPAGTEAVALDVEGRWVIFVRPSGSALIVAKVAEALGGGGYIVQPQAFVNGSFQDEAGAVDVPASNLAELTLGPGAAVDAGTFVLLTTTVVPGSPATLRYVFDHPVYAKYL